MSVASLNNGSLQLSELVISNEKYSNATGYVASSSTFSAGVTGTSLSVPEISVSSLTASGDITCAALSNSGIAGTTFDTAGLTITRNITGGDNEFDFVAINPTSSTVGMCFYASQTEVVVATTPSLIISPTGISAPGINAPSIIINGNGSTTNPSLSTNASNNLVVSSAPTSGLTLSNDSGNITLSCTADNDLTLNAGGSSNLTISQITFGNGNLVLGNPSTGNLTLNPGGASTLTTTEIIMSGNVLTVNNSNQLTFNGVVIS